MNIIAIEFKSDGIEMSGNIRGRWLEQDQPRFRN